MERTHPDVQKLATMAQDFCFDWFRRAPGNRWRVVVGGVGCGKTRVSARIKTWFDTVAFTAWETTWKGYTVPSVIYANWLDLASPEKCTGKDFDFWIEVVDKASAVILDDIGTETDQFKTGIPAQRLCNLLNRCEQKWLWVNTNIEPEAWEMKWDKRVADRLFAARLLAMTAPTYRGVAEKIVIEAKPPPSAPKPVPATMEDRWKPREWN